MAKRKGTETLTIEARKVSQARRSNADFEIELKTVRAE